jgi:hypothetical protein
MFVIDACFEIWTVYIKKAESRFRYRKSIASLARTKVVG